MGRYKEDNSKTSEWIAWRNGKRAALFGLHSKIIHALQTHLKVFQSSLQYLLQCKVMTPVLCWLTIHLQLLMNHSFSPTPKFHTHFLRPQRQCSFTVVSEVLCSTSSCLLGAEWEQITEQDECPTLMHFASSVVDVIVVCCHGRAKKRTAEETIKSSISQAL